MELLETGAKKPGVGATLPTEKPGEREDGERERRKSGERVMESERGIDLGTGSRNEADERREVAALPAVPHSLQIHSVSRLKGDITHKSRKMKTENLPRKPGTPGRRVKKGKKLVISRSRESGASSARSGEARRIAKNARGMDFG